MHEPWYALLVEQWGCSPTRSSPGVFEFPQAMLLTIAFTTGRDCADSFE